MAIDMALEAPEVSSVRKRDFGSSARLWGGFFGRAWLWFLAACLVVTFLPMLFGWRPYVVESGSMQPRIKVGDVILSSPEHDAKKLLGHVTVFEDPDASRAGTVKSHRVIKINANGTLVTKGDANPTADPVPLPMSDVKGIGRLLVRWIGLPLIWVQQGQWLKLALLVGSLWLSAFLVVRDQDELVPDEEGEGEDEDEGDAAAIDAENGYSNSDIDYADDVEGFDADGPDDDAGWDDPNQDGAGARHLGESGPNAPLQWKPRGSALRRWRRARHRQPLGPAEFGRAFAVRVGMVIVAAASLLVPTVQAAQAAFSATTASTASTWATAASFIPDYTADAEALNPYLYWKLDDAVGTKKNQNTTALDYSANNRNGLYDPTPYSGGFTMQQPGAFASLTPNYSVLSAGGTGNNASCITTNAAAESSAPVTYSEIIWFKTANGYTGGGKLIGFESEQTGVSNNSQGGQYDRMVFMDTTGHLTFGVWTGATTTVTTNSRYNDGNWHMAVATMGGGTGGDGMKLYVDGALVGSNVDTVSQDYTSTNGGWWRVGCGNLQGWGSNWTAQTNYAFTGNLDEATVYTTELSAQDIANLYSDATWTPPAPPVSFTNGDFETGSLSPWTCSGASIVTNPTHGGSGYALSVTNSFFQTKECDQAVTAAPNHTYTLTAYVSGTQATIGVSGGATGSSQPGGNGWQQANFTFTTDSTGAFTVYVRSAYVWGATIYADDISIS